MVSKGNNTAYTIQCVLDEWRPSIKMMDYIRLKKTARRLFKRRIMASLTGAATTSLLFIIALCNPQISQMLYDYCGGEVFSVAFIGGTIPTVLILWAIYQRSERNKFMQGLEAFGRTHNYELDQIPTNKTIATIDQAQVN